MKEYVPNTPYVKDPSGVWYQETNLNPFANLKQEPEAPSPEEKIACDGLAESLFINWMKSKPGKVLDMGAVHTGLVDAFNRRGCQGSVGNNVILTQKKDLITWVHAFQKIPFNQVGEILKSCRDMLNPNGTLFIRMPDHDVAGYERDLTAEHYESALCFWNLDGFLELLYQNPYFKIAETYAIPPGQRDYLLKPIKRKPSVCAGIIAKNEERDIAKCIESLRDIVEGVYLVDTGSTDKTIEVAQKLCAQDPSMVFEYEIYTGASEKDDTGDWKLWNFSQARNQYVKAIDAAGYDYLLWMDADDVVVNKKLKNLVFLDQYGIHGTKLESGGLVWPHHRLWKTKRGITYTGRCHEYPNFGGNLDIIHNDVFIKHDAAPAPNVENSNPRNLRILKKEFEEEPTPRCAFYLANTYKDSGQWVKAIPVYQKRLDFGKGYEDEYWFAVLYKARCEKNANQQDHARRTLLKAVTERPAWAEFWMELCFVEYSQNKFKKALGYAYQAMDLPVVPTNLFRERQMYFDQPYRMASWCYEHLGEHRKALDTALIAKDKIGSPDADWNSRIERLKETLEKSQSNIHFKGEKPIFIPLKKKKPYVWLRPGALGDVLMTLNLTKKFREKYPDSELIYRCHETTANILGKTILTAGFDAVETLDKPTYAETFNLIGYPLKEGYPYKPMQKHLIEYFAAELGVEPDFDGFKMPLPERSKDILEDFPTNGVLKYATIHAKAGWSMYKNWSMEKWERLCYNLKASGIVTIQIGGGEDPKIENATYNFLGANFDKSLSILAHAKIHIGIDSWSNHATNIQWEGKGRTPGVILWGSTQHAAAGYKTNRNISMGLPCQPCFREDPKISQVPLGVCPHPAGQTYERPQHKCMADITVERVYQEVMELWDETH